MSKSSKSRGAKPAQKPAGKSAKTSARNRCRASRRDSAARAAAAEETQQRPSAEDAATASQEDSASESAPAPWSNPLDARALAEEVFAKKNPVQVAVELLGNDKPPKNASVKARVWETLVEYCYGRPAAMSDSAAADAPQIIFDIPRPDRESGES